MQSDSFKIMGTTFLGLTISIADVESFLRIGSLILSMVLSLLIYRHNKKRLQNDNKPKDNSQNNDNSSSADGPISGNR